MPRSGMHASGIPSVGREPWKAVSRLSFGAHLQLREASAAPPTYYRGLSLISNKGGRAENFARNFAVCAEGETRDGAFPARGRPRASRRDANVEREILHSPAGFSGSCGA
jgi:hypothetical protein